MSFPAFHSHRWIACRMDLSRTEEEMEWWSVLSNSSGHAAHPGGKAVRLSRYRALHRCWRGWTWNECVFYWKTYYSSHQTNCETQKACWGCITSGGESKGAWSRVVSRNRKRVGERKKPRT